MNLLLDTHAFLWYYSGSSNLSTKARFAIENPENDFFVSMASLWEISIKNGLGKLDLDAPLDTFFKDIVLKGFNLMPIDPSHILQSAALPSHHRDPFDRIIIGQALAEQMPVVTKDSLFEPYCQSSELQLIW
ncbi:MAG: type II toxin-antitoxin system VapC family toxin [Phycisphaerae bacterium]|nr:type II toxin-antitoxin system VapC family toxin [Saprospiraceae bacterium]